MRNFFTGYTITETWAGHLARGSLGGIDRAMGMGTALPACAAGVVTYIAYNGSGGHTATIRHDDGTKTQYMHMSRFALASGTRVNEGDIVGFSGGCAGCDGAGTSTGPHLHAHSIDTAGNRIPPLYEDGSATAGGGSVDWMGGGTVAAWIAIQKWLTAGGLYSGLIDGDPRTLTWTGLQNYLAANWGYTGTVDGEPGVLSWSAVQRWLAAGYGYTGDVDGVPGPLTAAALNRLGAALSTPTPADPKLRKVLGPLSAIRRTGASRASTAVEPDLAVDATVTVVGWVNGEQVEGNKVWFKIGAEYSWSGNFTNSSTVGLTDLNTTTPPPVVTPPSSYYRPADAPAGVLFGVDVSRFQLGFDFAKYRAEAKEDFAILKRGGSNSGTYIDSQYVAHLAKARAAGLKIGHYWFNGREGVATPTASAQAFLAGIDVKPGELLVLDIESEGTMPHYTAAETLEFGAEVERVLGVKPLLYMSASVARQPQWIAAVTAGYKLWVAMYSYLTTSPDVGKYVPNDINPLGAWGGGDAWVIHQYTSTVFGVMPGAESMANPKSLDRNIARPDVFSKYGFVKLPEVVTPPEPEPSSFEQLVLTFITDVRDAATKALG